MSPSTMHIAAQRSDRAGQPMLVMALASACIAIMASFAWLPNEQTPMLLLVLLLGLAFVGALALIGFAAGFLRTNATRAGDDIARLLTDTSPDGLLVTEGEFGDPLRQRRLCGAGRWLRRGRPRRRPAHGRPAVLGRAGSRGAALPAGAGRARGKALRRGIARRRRWSARPTWRGIASACARWNARTAGGSSARPPARAGACWRCGPSPT